MRERSNKRRLNKRNSVKKIRTLDSQSRGVVTIKIHLLDSCHSNDKKTDGRVRAIFQSVQYCLGECTRVRGTVEDGTDKN